MANSADPDQLASSEANWSGSTLFAKKDISGFSRTRVKKTTKKNQEAQGPRLVHLSNIATVDMQMLCNIFANPIIATIEKTGSSFKQFLVLKMIIWAWQSMELDHLNKHSITFQLTVGSMWNLVEIGKVVSEESWFYTCKQHSGREIKIGPLAVEEKSFKGFSTFSSLCQCRIIILAIVVDLQLRMTCAKIRPKGFLGSGDEDF